MKTAGYSGTPLVDKIGIKPAHRLLFRNAPATLPRLLGKLPEGATQVDRGKIDVGILFSTSVDQLERQFASLARRLESNGMLWISWPKKASGMKTDLNENLVRDLGLAHGLVDVKVCAIDETWSGLKFVIRMKDRK